MLRPLNPQRAGRFGEVIGRYGIDDFSDEETNLIDLLADAMHWCDSTGSNFHFALAQACRHYINELNDEQLDERRIIP